MIYHIMMIIVWPWINIGMSYILIIILIEKNNDTNIILHNVYVVHT